MSTPLSYLGVEHGPQWLFNKLGFLSECAASGAAIIELKLGKKVYLLNNHEDIKHVLETNYANYLKHPRLNNRTGKQLFGEGVQTQYGDSHQQQRRQVQSAFVRKAIAPYAPEITALTAARVETWGNHAELDMVTEILKLTHVILGKLLFGLDFSHSACPLGEAVLLRRHQVDRQFSWQLPLISALNRPQQARLSQGLHQLEQAVDQMILVRRSAPDQYQDLLSMFVKLQSQQGVSLTDKQLRDEAIGTSGGYETIAAAVIWVQYLLALHPQVENSFRQELDQVLGTQLPTVEDIPNLRYTKMLLNESLRLYPPTWILARFVQQPDQLPSGQYLAAKAKLYLSPYVIHRNPLYFPNPQRFDPERFSETGKKAWPKFAYIPFGAGPRVCIGQALSEMTVMLILVTLAQRARFTLLLGQTILPRSRITLLPRQAMKMRVSKLEQAL